MIIVPVAEVDAFVGSCGYDFAFARCVADFAGGVAIFDAIAGLHKFCRAAVVSVGAGDDIEGSLLRDDGVYWCLGRRRSEGEADERGDGCEGS